MTASRGFIVLGLGALAVLTPFLIFVMWGWPGRANSCIFETPPSCFCERFEPAEVLNHSGGVRQPVNTWFNLYSLVTASIIAVRVYFDRRPSVVRSARNLMRSRTSMPDLYVFVVLFLGLGSMWFHASLTHWGGILDGLSMYTYAAFLVFYSARRIWNNAIFFWIAYPATVALFTLLHDRRDAGCTVLVLVLTLVVAYLAIEIAIWIRTGKVMQGKVSTVVLWLSAVVAIVLAMIFWALSQTGRPMCWPQSWFQPHGLLWHPLAGVMAVLLYFYWRSAEDLP